MSWLQGQMNIYQEKLARDMFDFFCEDYFPSVRGIYTKILPSHMEISKK